MIVTRIVVIDSYDRNSENFSLRICDNPLWSLRATEGSVAICIFQCFLRLLRSFHSLAMTLRHSLSREGVRGNFKYLWLDL